MARTHPLHGGGGEEFTNKGVVHDQRFLAREHARATYLFCSPLPCRVLDLGPQPVPYIEPERSSIYVLGTACKESSLVKSVCSK